MKYSRANKVSELLLWYKKITILFESMLRLFQRLQKKKTMLLLLSWSRPRTLAVRLMSQGVDSLRFWCSNRTVRELLLCYTALCLCVCLCVCDGGWWCVFVCVCVKFSSYAWGGSTADTLDNSNIPTIHIIILISHRTWKSELVYYFRLWHVILFL